MGAVWEPDGGLRVNRALVEAGEDKIRAYFENLIADGQAFLLQYRRRALRTLPGDGLCAGEHAFSSGP